MGRRQESAFLSKPGAGCLATLSNSRQRPRLCWKRSEPVKVYSSTLDEPNTQNMLPIGVFEAPPETPEVSELEAFLEKGAMVKLDCMRLPSPMVPAMPHYHPENGWRISRGRFSLAGSGRTDDRGVATRVLPCAVWRRSFQAGGPPCRGRFETTVEGCRQAVGRVYGSGVSAPGRENGDRSFLPIYEAATDGRQLLYRGDDRDIFGGAGFARVPLPLRATGRTR